MLRTTAGQFLINDALPEDLRDYNRVLDKEGVKELYRRLATEHPDDYARVSKRLADIGREASTESGGYSIGLSHLEKTDVGRRHEQEIRDKVYALLNDRKLSGSKLSDAVIHAVGTGQEQRIEEIYQDALARKNPAALQVLSGSRGNKMNLSSLIGSDWLYSDHHDNVIPLPVLRSYSQGLSPIEYLAGTYGARKGVMATKFATQEAGFLSKQLNQIAHRLMVVDQDEEVDPTAPVSVRGLPVDTDDMDNAGALLAYEAGGYKRNTPLTPKILKDLSRRGIKRLLVRSPLVGGTPEGGLYARDVGIRENGLLPGRGEQIGLQSAQALSEPINQGQLNAKHVGGVANQDHAVSGFEAINQQVQIPKGFKGGAAHAEADGLVQRIEPAPAGGLFVYIDGKRHYVGLDDHGKQYELKVKRGDRVEAGDMISEGIPHWGLISKYKGLGEGRRYFATAFVDAMRSAGIKANRRNAEVIARGLVNHVRLTDEVGDGVPDDVVPYSMIEQTYQPREGYWTTDPSRAVGKYLERPVLHHTIGTRVRPSMLKDFQEFGVTSLDVHNDPPPFEPEPIRGMANLQHDHDWMVRMYGSNLKDSLLDSVHRGGTSNELGTSFVPGLARAVDFGRQGLVRPPEPGTKPEDMSEMASKKPAPQTLNLSAIAPPKRFGVAPMRPSAFKAVGVDHSKAAAEKIAEVRKQLGFDKEAMGPLDPTGSSGPAGSSATQHKAPTQSTGPSPYKPQKPMQPRPRFSLAQPPQSQTPAPQPPQQPAQTLPSGEMNYTSNAQTRYGNPQSHAVDPWAQINQEHGLASAPDDYRMRIPDVQGDQLWMQPSEEQQPGEEQFSYALQPEGGQAQPGPGFDYGELARRIPQYGSRSGIMLGAAADPLGTAVGYGAQKTLQGVGTGGAAVGRWAGGTNVARTVAPRAASWLSGLGQARVPPGLAGYKPVPGVQMLGQGSKLTGKTLPALGGLMNVAWAPLEAGTLALQGDTEAAKKLFYDPEYNRSMGDTSRSYLGRAWEASDPRNFYRNATALGEATALSKDGIGTTADGFAQQALGVIGQDDTSRHNRFVATDEGKRQMLEDAWRKGDEIFQHNLNRALQDGRGAHDANGQPVPSQTWADQWWARPENQGKPFDAMHRAWLNATFNFPDYNVSPEGYADWENPPTPTEMWQRYHDRKNRR